MPRLIGAVVLGGRATLLECQTVYSVEDVHDLYELMIVDANNRRAVNKAIADGNG